MRSQTVKPRSSLPSVQNSDLGTRIDIVLALIAVVALAATSIIGTLAAGGFITAALALMARNPVDAGKTLFRLSPLLLIPVLGMISTVWSDAPERTMRAAIQLLLTMAAALVVCRRLEARYLILTLFLSFLGIVATALPFLPRDLSGGGAWRGLFDSKNQLGVAIHLCFATGLAVGLDRSQAKFARLAAIIVSPVVLTSLPLTQSGTSMTSAAVTIVLFPLLVLFGRVPLTVRKLLLIILIIVLGVALLFLPQIMDGIADFRQNVLKKDATLTGRTYLWEYAARLTAERPLLGHGYYAFWRVGNLDAEGLWRWGGISNRSGFNFHNAFVEMKVDLGYVGQGLLILSCAVIFMIGLYRQVVRPSVPIAFFLSLQAVMYLRSLAETGLIAPFSLLTALWVSAGVYALWAGSPGVPGSQSRITKQARFRTGHHSLLPSK